MKGPAETNADAVAGADGDGDERRAEFAGIYAGGMVESDTDSGVGADVADRDLCNVMIGYYVRQKKGHG